MSQIKLQILENYVRSIPSSEKNEMILKLSALRLFAFAEYAQRSENTIVPFCIQNQKLLSHSLTRWLSFNSSLPRML